MSDTYEQDRSAHRGGAGPVTIDFSPGEDETGLVIDDAVERRQCTLRTSTAIAPRPIDTDRFRFPVDAAVAVEAESLTLPSVVATYVRDEAGEMLTAVEHFDCDEFDSGVYTVELEAPVKLYVRTTGPVTVSTSSNATTVERASAGEFLVGARSYHEQPATTITTTGEPRDVMRAVSALSSSLKSTSPERSFPSLRGHPPTIELGDELDVPPELSPPDTGVRIEVPPKLRYVYPVAPLAFYLGATVEPGPTPRLCTDDGLGYPLDAPDGFADEVERVLKRAFLLDCVVRTEGYYRIDLHERRELERRVDLDPADLYDRPLPDQLRAYLDVPYALVEDLVPEWKLSTHVDPTPENAELLPFLVNDLAVIRPPEAQPVTNSEAQMAALDEFTRDAFTRSAATNGDGDADGPSLVQPSRADSLEQAWAGSDAPVGASKASVQAFRNRLDRETSDGDIDITVVCNDDAMDEEGDVAESVYGSREELPFDVRIHRNLSTEALRLLLETDSDFLHYIGHIDEDGFDCTDGRLDASELDAVGVDAFFLNACRSYGQGMALIEGGAIGGVVTLTEVVNSGAVRVGKTMIRLLNQGFPLRAALDIAEDQSIVGGQYIVVGDGNVDVVQCEDRAPVLLQLENEGDELLLTPYHYPTRSHGMGSFSRIPAGNPDTNYLTSGPMDTMPVTAEGLRNVLAYDEVPVRYRDELLWSQNVSASDFL
jgi:hypothetical protein